VLVSWLKPTSKVGKAGCQEVEAQNAKPAAVEVPVEERAVELPVADLLAVEQLEEEGVHGIENFGY